jgi:hypothetical protein
MAPASEYKLLESDELSLGMTVSLRGSFALHLLKETTAQTLAGSFQ